MAPSPTPIVFISYSHKDKRHFEFVRSHLQVAVANEHFETWDDRRIQGGGDWTKEIEDALSSCAAFILLVSRHSLVSTFILKREVKAVLEAHWRRGVHIYPILVEGCDIHAVPWLTKMNIRPADAKPLAAIPRAKRDEVMASLAAELRGIVNTLADKRTASRTEVFPAVSDDGSVLKSRTRTQQPEALDQSVSRTDARSSRGRNASNLELTFRNELQLLQVSSEVRQSALEVALHSEYPRWMSVAGALVRNPVWDRIPKASVRQLAQRYDPAGSSHPSVMHLDMLLIRRNDERGHGLIYTYLSPDWGTYLITFRQRSSEERRNERNLLSAAKIAKHWNTSADAVHVRPLRGKYAISVKPHARYQDLVFYVFEFCSVTFSDPSTQPRNSSSDDPSSLVPTRRWFDLTALRKDQPSWSVNGDVIRAVHELFTYDLGGLPVSVSQPLAER
jgi:hypothetical protein